MQRPLLWAAQELLLHMADETNTSIKHVKKMSSPIFIIGSYGEKLT